MQNIFAQFSTWIKIIIALFETTRRLSSKLLASLLKFLNIHKALDKQILNEVFQIFQLCWFREEFFEAHDGLFPLIRVEGKTLKTRLSSNGRGLFRSSKRIKLRSCLACRTTARYSLNWSREPQRKLEMRSGNFVCAERRDWAVKGNAVIEESVWCTRKHWWPILIIALWDLFTIVFFVKTVLPRLRRIGFIQGGLLVIGWSFKVLALWIDFWDCSVPFQ